VLDLLNGCYRVLSSFPKFDDLRGRESCEGNNCEINRMGNVGKAVLIFFKL
jgi:hypothetical protein